MNRTAVEGARRAGLIALVAFLFSVYTFTNAGKFHVVDEVSLFAVTESLVLHGRADTNAIAWTQWVNSPGEVLGAFGADGQVYSKKGPGPAFLAIPWYFIIRALSGEDGSIGLVQGTLLWNGILTAQTAALVWLSAVRLGYRDRIGSVLALLYGVGTIAWPYATQFFGEPLSAFSLLLCFYAGLAAGQSGRKRWMLVAGAAAGLAVATVTAHAIPVALLGTYALLRAGTRNGSGFDLRRGLVGAGLFVAPVIFFGAFLLWYNWLRFGSPFDTGYHFDSGEGFSTPLLAGLWGLLGSPYRGVFWFSPILVLGWISFPAFVRRHRIEGIVTAVVSLSIILLYSLWWMWWAGFAWGPRFLVPLTPFWMLWLAPWLEALERRIFVPGRRIRRVWSRLGIAGWVLIAVAALSTFVQVGAVVANFANYEIHLRSVYPTNWENPLEFGPPAVGLLDMADSPVLGQWKLLGEGFVANSDLAWLWPDGNVQWLVVLVGIAVLVTLAGTLAQWWSLYGDGENPAAPGIALTVLAAMLPLVWSGVWMSEVSRNPHYGDPEIGYRAIVRDVCEHAGANDAMVTVAPFAYQIPMNWMAALCADAPPIYGYATNSMEHPEAQAVLSRVIDEHVRLWFVTGGLPPSAEENSVERWLANSVYKANDVWYDDYRLVEYATSRPLTGVEARALNVPLVGAGTSEVTLLSVRAPAQVELGGILPAEISYRLEAPNPSDLRWFVQLLADDGVPAALLDAAPLDGYASFSTLPAGEVLIERAGLVVPENIPTGHYQLIAGLYNPSAPDAARLRSPDGSDFVVLGLVLVQ